ncbi:SRP receptor beta subunit [Colletotrichum tofieldiae]|nr:SRP receptor beta subunit [Colletotrichum tofieldiae]
MADKMGSFTEFFELIMTPSMPVILIGAAIVLLFPILLHYILIKSTPYTTLPSARQPSSPSSSAAMPRIHAHEPAAPDLPPRRYPGHGKLRNYAMAKLASSTSDKSKLKAILFMVDAAAISENEVLAPTASYLYDVLLGLQKRASSSKSSKPPAPIPVLVAANKTDLFTALPGALVKSNLEAEITRIRSSRSKGLLDSGVGIDEIGSEEHDDWLGAYGTEKFTFDQLREFDVDVDVIAGNVTGSGSGPDKWWSWIAQRI